MRRVLLLLALCAAPALWAGCSPAENTNSANTNAAINAGPTANANASLPAPPPVASDRITVEHPNLFLPGDADDEGLVTFTLEKVAGRVRAMTVRSENSTQTTDRLDLQLPPELDPNNYDLEVTVQLFAEGLTKTDPPDLRRPYAGQKEVWEWYLKPAAGFGEGARVSFYFRVDVSWRGKTAAVANRELRDVWRTDFEAEVGPPASRVNAALYGSYLSGFGGFVAFGTALGRRKNLTGAGPDEEGQAGGEVTGGEMTRREAEGGAAPPSGSEPDIVLESAGQGAEPRAALEEVSSTVYAPGEAAPGDAFLVQVFVHLPEQAEALDELAKEADEDARRRVTNQLQKKLVRGTELTFSLQMPGLDVDAPAQTCVWEGEPECVQFGVSVPEDCKPRNLIGTVTVSEQSVPIGHLKFKFKVASGAAAEPAAAPAREPAAAGQMVRYRRAFISYASKDRPEVLKRVQMLKLARIEFFQDLLTLEPGDSWEKMLYEYIDRSDVFFLFWSTAASQSEWVKKEVEYAVKQKEGAGEDDGPEIIPVIIEGPPPARPPAELSFLHFNDKLIYFINSREAETPPAA
jgi:TIR domain